jgi:hypothetical protein
MADADFYARNLNRNYPLIDESVSGIVAVPDNQRLTIVDFGLVLFSSSGFDPTDPEHRVLLSQVGPASQLTFEIYAAGAAVDGVSLATDKGTYPWQRSDLLLVADGVQHGYGWVVHGNPYSSGSYSYSALIGSAPLTVPYIEQRCLQVVDGHFVNKFLVANQPRTTANCATSEQGSSSSSVSINPEQYPFAPGGEAVAGDVRFREGYNCQINVLSRNNAMRFSARRGAGLGEPCEAVPRTYTELKRRAASIDIDCATRCHEVITNINGVEADASGSFRIQGGRGVEVVSPSEHTIRITGRESMEECE